MAGSGDIWFSDSSLHCGIEQWRNDLVEEALPGRRFAARFGEPSFSPRC